MDIEIIKYHQGDYNPMSCVRTVEEIVRCPASKLLTHRHKEGPGN